MRVKWQKSEEYRGRVVNNILAIASGGRLDDRLLSSRSELLAIWSGLSSRGSSVESIRESLVFNVKGCSSASQAFKLT
jgi:hypothetical protein